MNLLLASLYLLPHVLGKIEFDRLTKRIVITKYGKLRGVLVEFPSSTLPPVEAYLGIEYGSLLAGSLRFMPPTSPVEKWRGIRLANVFKPVCPQRELDETKLAEDAPAIRIQRLRAIQQFLQIEAEDCLYLNIYVPLEGNGEDNRLPIMVFVHGESYEYGSGNAYDGSVLASQGNVIVITLNYRLGPLGFLSGRDDLAGNYAIFDLIAALHWIKANIDDFGGDAEKVTLFGQGHGAALVNLLMLTPITNGMKLFHRAILQSGSALCSWAVNYSPNQIDELATILNCSNARETSSECLKKMPAKQLMNSLITSLKFTPTYGPVVDGKNVLPVPPETLLTVGTDSTFGNIEMLFGIGRYEGLILLGQKLLEKGVSATKRKSILRTYIRNMYEFHRQEIFDILMHQYSDWDLPTSSEETDESIKRKLVEILGDGQYTVPLLKTGLVHSSFQDTFFYVFGHSSEQERFPEWSGGGHGEDLVFVFGAPLADSVAPFSGTSYTKNERLLSEAVIRFWSNFAKTGNPNFPVAGEAETENNRFLDTFWPKFEQRRQEYLHIGMRPAINHHYRSDMVSVWLELIPKVHQTDELAPAHHLLQDHDNTSSFEAGTRGVEAWNIVLPPPPSPPLPPFTAFPRPATQAATMTAITVYETLPSFSERKKDGEFTAAITMSAAEMRTSPRPTTRPAPDDLPVDVTKGVSNNNSDVIVKQSEEGQEQQPLSLPLTITIAVGCALLFINAFIFVGIYFQRSKVRKEREAMKLASSQKLDKPDANKASGDELSLTAKANAFFAEAPKASASEERRAPPQQDLTPVDNNKRMSDSSYGKAHANLSDNSDDDDRENFAMDERNMRQRNGLRQRDAAPNNEPIEPNRSIMPAEKLIRTPARSHNAGRFSSPQSDHGTMSSHELPVVARVNSYNSDKSYRGESLGSRYSGTARNQSAYERTPSHRTAPQVRTMPRGSSVRSESGQLSSARYDDTRNASDDSHSSNDRQMTRDRGAPLRDEYYNGKTYETEQYAYSSTAADRWANEAHEPRRVKGQQHTNGYTAPYSNYYMPNHAKSYNRDRYEDDGLDGLSSDSGVKNLTGSSEAAITMV